MKKKLFAILLVLVLLLCAGCTKQITMPNAASDYSGQTMDEVISAMKQLGYSNIQLNSIEDLTSDSSMKDGTVESVSIAENSDFAAGDIFTSDVSVAITYHSIPKVVFPLSEEELQAEEADGIAAKLEEAGFTNVSTDHVVDLDPDTTDAEFVNELQINNYDSVEKGSEIPFDAEILVICHHAFEKYTVNISIDFPGNWIFDKYDVLFSVGEEENTTIPHGEDKTFELRLTPGTYDITFTDAENQAVRTKVELNVDGNVDVGYKITCHTETIDVATLYSESDCTISDNEIKLSAKNSEYYLKNVDEVVKNLEALGFTNITKQPLYDIYLGITDEGAVEDVSIDNSTSYYPGVIVSKDAPVVVTYHMNYKEDPNYVETTPKPTAAPTAKPTEEPTLDTSSMTTPEPTSVPTPKPTSSTSGGFSSTSSSSMSYSTNDSKTVKDGNKGVYAYKNSGANYDIYYIIDFDNNCVYTFTDGNGDSTCDRVPITSGDLNSTLIITWHDGSDTWSYGLHFKYKNQPDHLVLEDNDHFEYDYRTTNLDDALKIKNSRTIYDY